jgi:hypothetical protein
MVRALLRWAPRVLGLAVALFFATFALGALQHAHGGVLQIALAAVMHLGPALLALVAVALGWWRPWAGAGAFLALAAGYAALTPERPDWILVIAGPLALVGVLFALSATARSGPRSPPGAAGSPPPGAIGRAP